MSRRLWTDEEVKFLEDNRDMTNYRKAKELGRAYTSVCCKVSKLSLHREFRCVVCDKAMQQGKYCQEHNWISRRVTQILYRSKQRGYEVDLSEDDIVEMVQEDCYYCGLTGSGIDRVDSAKGYTKDNTVPCCRSCNTMKLDYNLDEWKVMMIRILTNMENNNE